MNNYFLYLKDSSLYAYAEKLVQFTNSIVLQNELPKVPIWLSLNQHGLAIESTQFKPLYTKDIYLKLNFRKTNLTKELLIQSIHLKPAPDIRIFDLTAGLAKDASLLANYGYSVTMLESNPLLATILYDASLNGYLPMNLDLIYADSIDFLNNYIGEIPQVIYLDPMFKETKQAKAKKDMQLVQSILDLAKVNTLDSKELLQLALTKTSKKLIVKRDNKQQPLVITPKLSYSKLGKTVRYDVYLISNKS